MTSKRLALFVRNGLVGHEVLCRILPAMLNMGIKPIIYNTGDTASTPKAVPELIDMSFYETKLLKDVVFPYLDRNPLGEIARNNGAFLSFNSLQDIYGAEYHDVPNVNDSRFLETLSEDSDLIGGISVRILKKFSPELISILESKGFLANLHTGDLPKFRGLHSPFWAISKGVRTYNWTLHRMDKHFDTGPLLCRTQAINLDPRKPVLESYLEVAPMGADTLEMYLRYCLENGAIEGLSQKGTEGHYFTNPTPNEVNEFTNLGVCFANPANIPDIYAERFSILGTDHYKNLRYLLIQKIAEYEQSMYPDTHHEIYTLKAG